MGSSHAASVSITGPANVNKFDTPTFDFETMISGFELPDLDAFQILLTLTPVSGSGGANFVVSNQTPSNPDYVFFGNSDSYQEMVTAGGDLSVNDTATLLGGPATDVVGKLLGIFSIDVSMADIGDVYSVSVSAAPGQSFMVSSDFQLADIVQLGSYEFTVVPVPAAAILLGSGLLVLLGFGRRRNSKV